MTEECAGLTGLKKGTFVAYGGGDSLMMELGNGMIRGGLMASTIGTACHLTCALDAPLLIPSFGPIPGAMAGSISGALWGRT